VEARCLQDQLDAVAALGPLTSQRLSATEVEGLLQEGRGGDLHSPAPAWLLRLGVNPASTPRLLEAGTADALKLELGAGSGLGMAWSEEPIPASRVEALRTLCQELGGFLTVLRQPPDANLIPWRDASAKTLIEAVKRAFDPKGQLAPGRLPGVAVPAQSVVTR